jgi:hypothetical protein
MFSAFMIFISGFFASLKLGSITQSVYSQEMANKLGPVPLEPEEDCDKPGSTCKNTACQPGHTACPFCCQSDLGCYYKCAITYDCVSKNGDCTKGEQCIP